MRGRGYEARNFGAGFRDWAEGMKVLAQTDKQYMENRREALIYRFQAQQLYAEKQAAKHDKPATAEALARYAKAQAPRQLAAVFPIPAEERLPESLPRCRGGQRERRAASDRGRVSGHRHTRVPDSAIQGMRQSIGAPRTDDSGPPV